MCEKLYFPLAEEPNKWKMFSHTPLGPGPERLFFESRAQCCLSAGFFCCPPLLTYISEPQFPPNPSFELITYTVLVRYSLLNYQHSLTKFISVV